MFLLPLVIKFQNSISNSASLDIGDNFTVNVCQKECENYTKNFNNCLKIKGIKLFATSCDEPFRLVVNGLKTRFIANVWISQFNFHPHEVARSR